MPRSRAAIGLKMSPATPAVDDGEHDGDERGEAEAGLRADADVAGLRREVRVAVGADGEEEGVGEGELAGLADEQVEAEGGDHGGEGEHADLEPEGVEVEGRDERRRRRGGERRRGSGAG